MPTPQQVQRAINARLNKLAQQPRQQEQKKAEQEHIARLKEQHDKS
jgi:hypothetical protein